MTFVEIAENYVKATVKKSMLKNGTRKIDAKLEYTLSQRNMSRLRKDKLMEDYFQGLLETFTEEKKAHEKAISEAEKSYRDAENIYLNEVMTMDAQKLTDAASLLKTKADEIDKKINDRIKAENKKAEQTSQFDLDEAQLKDEENEKFLNEIETLRSTKFYYEVYGKTLKNRADLEREEL